MMSCYSSVVGDGDTKIDVMKSRVQQERCSVEQGVCYQVSWTVSFEIPFHEDRCILLVLAVTIQTLDCPDVGSGKHEE